jgi:hypothetical protein
MFVVVAAHAAGVLTADRGPPHGMPSPQHDKATLERHGLSDEE